MQAQAVAGRAPRDAFTVGLLYFHSGQPGQPGQPASIGLRCPGLVPGKRTTRDNSRPAQCATVQSSRMRQQRTSPQSPWRIPVTAGKSGSELPVWGTLLGGPAAPIPAEPEPTGTTPAEPNRQTEHARALRPCYPQFARPPGGPAGQRRALPCLPSPSTARASRGTMRPMRVA